MDDQVGYAEVLKSRLEAMSPDFEIFTALDSVSALAILSTKGPFDAVVTDLLLSQPSESYRLLESIRSGATAQNDAGTPYDVPIVCLSGQHELALYAGQFSAYVEKTAICDEELFDVLSDLFRAT